MKTMLVALAVLTGIASASAVISGSLEGILTTQFTAVGDTLYSYLLNVDDYYAAFSSGLTHKVADDFTLNGDYTLTGFGTYSITPPDSALPGASDLDVIIYEDNNPGPGQELWNHNPTEVTLTDTGLGQFGADILYTYHQLDTTTPFTAQADSKYWITSWRQNINWYFLCAGTTVHGSEAWMYNDDQWSPISDAGTGYTDPADMFMVLEGSPLGLENCTWGRIKNIF